MDPEKPRPYIPGVACASHLSLPLAKACAEKDRMKRRTRVSCSESSLRPSASTGATKCACVRVCVRLCVWECARALVTERLIPFWIFVLTCNIKLASRPSPLYLPVTFPALTAMNSLSPSPVSHCPPSSHQSPGSGPCPPQLPSTLTGFSLRCPQVSSARELPSEPHCGRCATLTGNVPYSPGGAGRRWWCVFEALHREHSYSPSSSEEERIGPVVRSRESLEGLV